MAGYITPHLVRRTHSFSFRMAIPRQLRSILGQREIKISLRTADVGTARLRCRALTAFFVQLIAKVEAMIELDDADIEAVARRYFAERLGNIQQIVADVQQDADLDLGFEASDSLSELKALRKMLVSRQFDGIAWSEAETALSLSGITLKKLGIDTRENVCAAILRARMEHHRIYAASLEGRFDELAPRDPMFVNLQSTARPEAGSEIDLLRPPRPRGLTLLEAAQKYVEFKGPTEWAKKTLLDNQRVLGLFGELVGNDRQLSAIASTDVKEFRDALRTLPPNYSKKPEYRGLDVREVLKRVGGAEGGLSAKTSGKYLDLLRSFLRWCVAEEYLDKVPGEKVTVPGITREASVDELLLFLLTEWILGAPQVIAKLALKTNPQMPVHGADVVESCSKSAHRACSTHIGRQVLRPSRLPLGALRRPAS